VSIHLCLFDAGSQLELGCSGSPQMDHVREFTSDHPVLVLLLVGAALRLLPSVSVPRRIVRLFALVVVLAYAVLALWYLSFDGYYDLAEPTIASVSWLVRLGHSPYHAADAASRYAHIYGPALFLVNAVDYRLFGPGIQISKLAGVIGGLVSLSLFVGSLARRRNGDEAVTWGAVCVLVYLCFGDMSFWTRAEPLLLLCTTAALVLAGNRHTALAVIGTGAAAGLALSLKLTGFLYIAPIVAVLLTHHRTALVAVAGVALAVSAAPFLVLPDGAGSQYWFWFHESSESGIRLHILRPNIEWAVFLIAPLAIRMSGGVPQSERSVIAILLSCISMVIVVAAKPGAGPYHLLPFVPVILWLAAQPPASSPVKLRGGTAAYVVTLVILAGVQQSLFVHFLMTTGQPRALDDLRQFLAGRDGSRVDMGYGGPSMFRGSGPLTYVRPFLTFRSGGYLLDAPAIQEHQLAGIEIPAATLRSLKACEIQYWLVPRGDAPFATRNLYARTGHRPLFPEPFQVAFDASYRKAEPTAFYDVYECTARQP
jgi:hypothetical protein